ncbi:lipopolysaccharide biosynthesis protein [Neokomagataea thailandica NBRC 106555]|uniref:Capsule biosynthesis protein n=2 Tax=Neokomagataea TaxID=1223423 RepID=A0A4Y6V4F7_9PROT|nr:MULTISPECIES: capsule biosynthesis protein [Neokomagataea]QDH24949.1 capsule biosynthesis protein [Neokomagataea tanensis]GBR51655.1 lipopolysaccharide biosynthesis protein [Neokomagataea thailandica NBRC 106555]
MNDTSLTQIRGSKNASGLSSRVIATVKRHAGFCTVVLIPTFISAVYFSVFASPQYVSEAQFIVQGQHNQSNMMLAGLLEAGGAGGASEDTYAVQDYLTSRDAAEFLMKTQNLASAYRVSGADTLARFPNFYSGHTFEHFYAYYRRHVVAELDTTTGVSTLQVRTFSAQDSQRIARALVVAAENLINQMNDRQRKNTVAASEKEFEEATKKLAEVNKKIDAYRDQIAMLNPTIQSQPVLKDIAALQTTLTTTRVELAQLQRSTPNSPLIEVYKRRLAALSSEISHVETGVTGSDLSFVPKISGYDNLVFQRVLFEKEVAGADASVAAAKLQADRQLLYLNEITQPNLPDYAAYPRGLVNVAIVFATMLGIYLMAMLLISGAREHKLV